MCCSMLESLFIFVRGVQVDGCVADLVCLGRLILYYKTLVSLLDTVVDYFLFYALSFYNKILTRNSTIADKLYDTIRGQSRSPNTVQFHTLGMVSC